MSKDNRREQRKETIDRMAAFSDEEILDLATMLRSTFEILKRFEPLEGFSNEEILMYLMAGAHHLKLGTYRYWKVEIDEGRWATITISDQNYDALLESAIEKIQGESDE